jgi:hypothetical protein
MHSDAESGHVIRVDSAMEQYAYLTATFGAPSRWQVISQTWRSVADEMIEVTTLRLPTGDSIDVQFGEIAPDESDDFAGRSGDDGDAAVGWLDDVMERATTFSQENPPHHPGTIARFPVPAAGYADALSVPMAVIAVDDSGLPGLYAPPRMVALERGSLNAIGVGEFPDFDPEFWPPERLANWPISAVTSFDAEQLQGIIQRFSACWSRVIAAWFGDAGSGRYLAEDITAALECRRHIDTEGMAPYYEKMNPVFAKWLKQKCADSEWLVSRSPD